MASILILKRRIRASSNVSKTTRAMQMIAASKMKRAQDCALSVRPYAEKLILLSQTVTGKLDYESLHPYMQTQTGTDKTLFLIFSPDKGLCGSLITNLLSQMFKEVSQADMIINVGKKIEHYAVLLNKKLLASFPFGNTLPTLEVVYSIIQIIQDYYLNKKVDNVKILYTSFASVFSQKPEIITLLPITISVNPESETVREKSPFQLFEPSVNALIPNLLKKYLEITIYQKLLESYVSEQASRMIAMQNATNNAKDIILDLTLEYNKTRQARITSEILDISGAANNAIYE